MESLYISRRLWHQWINDKRTSSLSILCSRNDNHLATFFGRFKILKQSDSNPWSSIISTSSSSSLSSEFNLCDMFNVWAFLLDFESTWILLRVGSEKNQKILKKLVHLSSILSKIESLPYHFAVLLTEIFRFQCQNIIKQICTEMKIVGLV